MLFVSIFLTFQHSYFSVLEETRKTEAEKSQRMAGANSEGCAQDARKTGQTKKEHSVQEASKSGQENQKGEEKRTDDTGFLGQNL